MAYTPEQILVKCPEKWEEHILLEWTIREANQRLHYLLFLLDPLLLTDLEIIQDDLLINGTSEKLQKHLKILYLSDYALIHFVLKQFGLPFEINEDEISFEYLNLLELLIKQNNIVKYAIADKAKDDEFKQENIGSNTSLDIYDTIINIMQLGVIKDLTLLNYKDLLTYSQLDFLAEKVANFHKRRMLEFFEPLIHGLGAMFANENNKAPDFRKILFVKEDKSMSKYEKARKIWFMEKWNDKKFVISRAVTIGLELSKFYPESEIPEEYKEKDKLLYENI